MNKEIRWISLKNNGGFTVSIRVKGGSESYNGDKFPLGQERTVDLADAVGKIKDGDTVYLEAVVKWGDNVTAKERFTYRKSANLKARYSIKGGTKTAKLSYNGVEECFTKISEPIRWISLKNNGGFAVSIRVNGGSASFNSSSFPIDQERTVDLTEAVGKIKDGDEVWLEAVVHGGNNNIAKQHFIYRKSSNKKAHYSIKGTTLHNSLSYDGITKTKTETMYTFIKNYPEDRENGWSDELQGVCHDESNWFFTQNGNIWKFPLNHDINATCKSENRAKGVYKKRYGYRLGDFDYSNGFLFIPVTGDGKPYIAAFKASDLSYVAKTRIEKFGTDFSSLHWCAINPTDQCLYTSDENAGNDFTENTSPVMVYSIDWNRIGRGQDNFLTQKTFITLYNNSGERLTREYVQGGCFDLSNHLHINNGDYTLKTINHNYANDKGGISVFYIPPIPLSGASPYYRVKRIAYSNQSGGFRYQFNGTGEEPSGITYWDLTNKKVGGKVCGCLHAIMSDNAGIGDDDFYFKHFERTSVTNRTMSSSFSKMGVIITALKSESYYVMKYDENRRRRKNQELVSGLYNNRRIDYTIIENMPLSGVEAILNAIYSRALDSSTNYIYINCHGYDDAGYGLNLGYSLTNDGEISIGYSNLHNRVLSKIRGKRVVLIDSCHSGGATDLKDSNSYILCSTKESNSAYGDSVLGNYATRYWVCGAGYDFLPGAAHDMEADKNKDNKVTLKELCDYTNKKIIQSCIMISDKPNTVIFE